MAKQRVEFEVDVPHGLKVSGASLGGSKVVSLRSGGVTFNKNETVWRPLQLVCAELIGELTIQLEQDFKWPEDLAPRYRWLYATPFGHWYFNKEKPVLQSTGWGVGYKPYAIEDHLLAVSVLNKTTKSKHLISAMSTTGVYLPGVGQVSYDVLLRDYTFSSGSPCGKKV